jgi:hypothetical protein
MQLGRHAKQIVFRGPSQVRFEGTGQEEFGWQKTVDIPGRSSVFIEMKYWVWFMKDNYYTIKRDCYTRDNIVKVWNGSERSLKFEERNGNLTTIELPSSPDLTQEAGTPITQGSLGHRQTVRLFKLTWS